MDQRGLKCATNQNTKSKILVRDTTNGMISILKPWNNLFMTLQSKLQGFMLFFIEKKNIKVINFTPQTRNVVSHANPNQFTVYTARRMILIYADSSVVTTIAGNESSKKNRNKER
jgi:hypothetical protein